MVYNKQKKNKPKRTRYNKRLNVPIKIKYKELNKGDERNGH